MTQKEREQAEARERLLKWIKPGDTIHTILRHCSRSGMQRVISLKKTEEDGNIIDLSYNTALACGMRYNRDREGIVIGGCGMDMGFALVYDLSYVLFGKGYQCLGKKNHCPSNYHSNYRSRIRCEGNRVHNPDGPDTGCHCYQREEGPRSSVDIGEGQTVEGRPLYTVEDAAGNIIICPKCKGEGYLPNPEGPERWNLIHTDGYALKHRWL